jgi:hypothetical protein
MDDDYEDYSEDARSADEHARFREEYGAEAAQEDLNSEVLDYVVYAHERAWSAVSGEIAKGHARLQQGELDEGIFHLYRALDHYFKHVLSKPVRAVFVERFNRSLPSSEKTEEDLFKAMFGGRATMDFAVFGVAVLVPDPKEREMLIDSFEGFKSAWKRRNEIFHNATPALDADVSTVQDFVNGTFERIAGLSETVAVENRRKRREYELSPVRVALLKSLASSYDEDRLRFMTDDEIGIHENDAYSILSRLVGEGNAEKRGHTLDREWRLTDRGRGHLRKDILPHIEGGQQ